MDTADEPVAVSKLKEVLQSNPKPLSINALTFKVKWGQGQLKDLGNCSLRTFLQSHPEVFKIEDGKLVSLAKLDAPAPAPEPARVPAQAPGFAQAPAPAPDPAREEPPQAKRPRVDEAPDAPVQKHLLTTPKGAPSSSPFLRENGNGAPAEDPAPAVDDEKLGAVPQPMPKGGLRVFGTPAPKRGIIPPKPSVGGVIAQPMSKTGAMAATPPGAAPTPTPAAAPEVASEPAVASRPAAPTAKPPSVGPAPWKTPGRVFPKAAGAGPPAAPEAEAEPGSPAAAVATPEAPPAPPAASPPEGGAAEAAPPGAAAVLMPKAAAPKAAAPKAAAPEAGAMAPKAAAAAPKAVPASEAPLSPPPPTAVAGPATGPVMSDWREDTLTNDELALTIIRSKVHGIDIELHALAARIAPSKAYQEACQRCLFALRGPMVTVPEAQRVVNPQQHVELGGSHAQGTEIDGAEVDLILRLPPEMQKAEREKLVQGLRQKLSSIRTNSVSDSMRRYPHCWSPLSMSFNDSPVVCHVMVLDQLPQQGNEAPFTLDAAVKRLCDSCEIARDIVRLVKLWATNHGLASQQDGHISSVAWALFAIFFLQKERRLIPPLSDLLQGGKAPPVSEQPELLALLRDFFAFFAARGKNPLLGFSVFDAQEFESAGPFVEDPAARLMSGQRRSLTEQVGQQQWARALDEARKVADKLSAKPQRWFHWSEVFDPRELPPEKIQKSQSLRDMLAGLSASGAVLPTASAPPAPPATCGSPPLAAPPAFGGFPAASPGLSGKGGCGGRPPHIGKGFGWY